MKINIIPAPLKEKIILARDLQVGQLAEIVEWSIPEYIGEKVCMVGEKMLISFSSKSFWADPNKFTTICKVKLLPEGSKIELIQE